MSEIAHPNELERIGQIEIYNPKPNGRWERQPEKGTARRTTPRPLIRTAY